MEVLYGHDSACIIDDGEYVDDWECIAEQVYQGYVDYMMPMILEEYHLVDNCVDGLPTALARSRKSYASCLVSSSEKIAFGSVH